MSTRRQLNFATLDRVMPDVDRLMEGYTTVGKWSLGQACNHLTTWISGSVDGFAGERAPWVVRKTIGVIAKREILKSGWVKEGIKVSDEYLPRPNLDDRAEAEALRAALHLFAANMGSFGPHPFFGTMTRAEWTKLHCIHCAHHLSFILPKGE